METISKPTVTVQTTVQAPIEKVWESFTNPKHITNWYHASDDWHAPAAENDLRTDGKFKTTMAAKDGSFSFDFEGVYTQIDEKKTIAYTIGDGRKVDIQFMEQGNETKVTETFETEGVHSWEKQRDGWQAILNNFKKYTETNA